MYEPDATTEFLDVDYALIAPNGQLYETHYEGHNDLAEELYDAGVVTGDTGKAYYGCVHVSGGDFDVIRGAGWYRTQDVSESRKVTQKQFDTMFAYKTARGESFSWEVLEVVDAEKPKTRTTGRVKSNPFSQVALA